MVPDEPALLTSRSFVRTRRWHNSWVNWHPRLGGGPVMTIRRGSVELRAPQGMMLESRNVVLSSEAATIKRDAIGWAGTPFGRRQCIRITAAKIEVAVTPEAGLDASWLALTDAGFREPSG
jgi:hypothetical protein